ncbi:MAG: pentapeptide repeat-containing protein [Hyphomicrobiaceae bacterium]|nr:pentapeptide repeat-containing protein [Hyphomicrobiaceae bacterium]
MNDTQRAVADEGEAPVNPYSLLEAVNDSSDTVHTGWLIFIAIMSYLLVAVAGVTHKELLLSRDIPLPVLQVGIELTRFFLFAPIVLVLFHMGIVTQLVMLARKALELDQSLQILEATDRRTHPLRLELHNFFFVQAIAGPERSRVVNGLLHGLSWLTLVALPVVVLLYIQVSFLPYHDVAITWAHRVALIADIAMLAMIGVFLTRPEQSLGAALWRSGLDHPLTFMLTICVLGAVAAFSFLVATVPGERLDRLSRQLAGQPDQVAPLGAGTVAYGFVVPFLGGSVDGRLLGIFERNLVVTDLDLVNDKDVTPGEPTLNLRRRDLRYARLDRTDLHQADLTGASLDGASLVGADLRNVLLRCADLNRLLLSEDRVAATCASAARANLTRARLNDSDLAGIDLTGARLEEADLTGVNLAHAALAGANLYNARLERADLTGGVAMQGANLATAALQGADLTGAKLDGADLTSAGLQGASLEFASLAGASLRDADLEGANLHQARLPAADLDGAVIAAASLREAWIWYTTPPARGRTGLADLAALRTSPPAKAEIEALEAMLRRIGDTAVERRVREALATVLLGGTGKALGPSEEAAARGWADILRTSTQEALEVPTSTVAGATSASLAGGGSLSSDGRTGLDQTAAAGAPSQGDRRARLSRHLGLLACKVRWADGSVATGVARRALGQSFAGDVASLYERLKAPSCPAARSIAPAMLQGLAAKVDGAAGR